MRRRWWPLLHTVPHHPFLPCSWNSSLTAFSKLAELRGELYRQFGASSHSSAYANLIPMRATSTTRVLLAFLLAPWIVPFVFLPYAWITVLTAGPAIQRDLTPLQLTLGALFMFGPTALMFAYCAELVLGLPFWLILKRGPIASRISFAPPAREWGWLSTWPCLSTQQTASAPP